MTGIKILNVTHNQLRTIPRNTFPKLYELHTIDVSHNEISEIYNGVFQTLFGLRYSSILLIILGNGSIQYTKTHRDVLFCW